MLVFGDHARTEDPRRKLVALTGEVRRLWAEPCGVARHGALVGALIAAGQLAQGLADARFEAEALDDRWPEAEAAMALTQALGQAVAVSWDSGFRRLPAPPDLEISALAGCALPEAVRVKVPEGYAFYAVYPEAYLEAARRLDGSGRATVIGLRSIGTGLAAMAAVGASAKKVATLRPCGDPFAREIRLAPSLAEELLDPAAGPFLIVDEGPGLSGSSLGAAADRLEAGGAEPDALAFLPSHGGDLGPEASAPHRARWARARREVVEFDALWLAPRTPRPRLADWFADLVGEAVAPLEDLSGGRWREHIGRAQEAWPPVHAQQERRKFLLRTGAGTFLLKFVGLGAIGEAKLELARSLHAAGFAPAPLGLRHGFLLTPWIQDARPLDAVPADRAGFVARLASYIAFRARRFAAPPEDGAEDSELRQMARRNIGLLLGEAALSPLAPRLDDPAADRAPVRRARTDNRMQAWEWLATADGRLLKADALDHHAAHDLIGCQDAAWDVAGAACEFDLTQTEVDRLCAAVEAEGARIDPVRLAFLRLCYPAFQGGYWALAEAAAAGPDRRRAGAARARYQAKLRREVS